MVFVLGELAEFCSHRCGDHETALDGDGVRTLIAKYVSAGKQKVKFVPRIAPSIFQNEEDQKKAVDLLLQVEEKHITMIDTRCKEAFNKECKNIPVYLLTSCLETLESNWLNENCFKIIAMVLHDSVIPEPYTFKW